MCDLPARSPPDGGQDPSGTPAAGRGPTRRGLLRSAGAAADVIPAAPWVTTAEAQAGNQGLLARLWMDELRPLFEAETGARINTQHSACVFLGRWAPVPRDRGQPFHTSGSLADFVMGAGLTCWVNWFQCGGALAHALTGEGKRWALWTRRSRMASARVPAQLSGGRQQRVALVIRPRLLLLDEPLGALDCRLRDQMQVELNRIQREAGIATTIVTHDQEEALSLSDCVAVMSGGRIAAIGAPADPYRRAGPREVMEFLGASNLLVGRVLEDGADEPVDDASRVRIASGEVLHVPGRLRPGAQVQLGLRPEAFAMAPATGDADNGTGNRLDGRMEEAVYKGAHKEFHIRGREDIRLIKQARGDIGAGLGIGQTVILAVAPGPSWSSMARPGPRGRPDPRMPAAGT